MDARNPNDLHATPFIDPNDQPSAEELALARTRNPDHYHPHLRHKLSQQAPSAIKIENSHSKKGHQLPSPRPTNSPPTAPTPTELPQPERQNGQTLFSSSTVAPPANSEHVSRDPYPLRNRCNKPR